MYMIYTYIYVYIYIYICVCVYIYIYICMIYHTISTYTVYINISKRFQKAGSLHQLENGNSSLTKF